MQITEVRIRMIDTESKMRAVASVTFDGCFVVHDIKIIDGQEGPFVAMPSRKIGDGEFRDVAHPIQQFMRDMIREAVFKEYDDAVRERMKMSEEEAEKVAAIGPEDFDDLRITFADWRDIIDESNGGAR